MIFAFQGANVAEHRMINTFICFALDDMLPLEICCDQSLAHIMR